jgi:hypothetical protein
MATTPKPLPMFGAWNEHWSNHPARLPISKYKPNTNPNTGAASVDAAYKAYQQSLGTATPPPATGTPSTPTVTPWNRWAGDFSGDPPAQNTPPATTPPATTPPAGQSFASKYTPAMLDQIYENPWYVLQDVYSGIKETSPLYQALRDMGADPLTLFNMTKGATGMNTGGASDFANWLNETYKGQGQVGGSRFSAQQLLGSLFGQDKFGADSKNTLGQILGAGDMSTQIRTLYNMAKDASNVSLNPLAARGYQSALAQAGDRYGDAMMKAGASETMNPSEWMRQNAPWLAIGT